MDKEGSRDKDGRGGVEDSEQGKKKEEMNNRIEVKGMEGALYDVTGRGER